MTAPAVSAAGEAVARFAEMAAGSVTAELGTTVLDARVEFRYRALTGPHDGMARWQVAMDGLTLASVVVMADELGTARAASVLGGVLHHWL